MSYAISGKIAGVGMTFGHGVGRRHGFRGFGDAAGDYAAQMAAYQSDHSAWLSEKAAYDRAVQAFTAQSAGLNAGYSQAQQAYQRDLAAWQAESAARSAALVARSQQQTRNQVAKDRANAAAQAQGVILPPGYAGCVTQAQHDSWQQGCSTTNFAVRGLGADPTGSLCALALLPVCPAPLPLPAALRAQPTPPPTPAGIAPPAAIRPEPQPPGAPPTPPVLNTGPQPIPSSPSPTPPPPPASTKSAGILSNGLLLVALAGGGYLLYRSLKKPKAAA